MLSPVLRGRAVHRNTDADDGRKWKLELSALVSSLVFFVLLGSSLYLRIHDS